MPQEVWDADIPDLVLETPSSWRSEHTPGPDFDVYYLVEPVGPDSAVTRIGIFVGMFPDLSSYEAGIPGPTGCVAGRNVEWSTTRVSTGSSRWKSEAIVEGFPGLPEPANQFRIHVWVFAADSSELVEARTWASTVAFDG